MRGGTAYCMVVVSDKKIASPYIDKCDTLFAFNQPSWDKFKNKVRKGGLALLNSSLIKTKKDYQNIKACKAPFTKIAVALGEPRVANMVALGVFIKVKKVLKLETVLKVFAEIAPKNKQHLIGVNKEALRKGYALKV